MNTNLNTTMSRTVLSTVAALAFAAVLPTAGMAKDNDVGIWKLNVAKSRIAEGAGMLKVKKGGESMDPAKTFLVISEGKVYLAFPADTGVAKVDYSNWKSMRLTQIGDKVSVSGVCSFRCQAGLPDNRLTINYRSVDAAGHSATHILAFDKQ